MVGLPQNSISRTKVAGINLMSGQVLDSLPTTSQWPSLPPRRREGGRETCRLPCSSCSLNLSKIFILSLVTLDLVDGPEQHRGALKIQIRPLEVVLRTERARSLDKNYGSFL